MCFSRYSQPLRGINHKEPGAAKPQPKKTFNRKERKGRKEEGTHHEGHEV
jgi:hypothetical protein